MGPPPFGSGNNYPPVTVKTSGMASMGPPPFGSGNLRRPAACRCRAACFNGATAFRKWKQRAIASQRSGMEALQWGHRLSAVETGGPYLRAVPQLPASMGPPPFGGGNGPLRGFRRRRTLGFNGATSFRWWKRLHSRPVRLRLCGASMGPPLSGGGNPRAMCVPDIATTLQWGHRLSKVETWTKSGRAIVTTTLQWGHLLSEVETAVSLGIDAGRDVASMGPPPFGSGNAAGKSTLT